MAAKPSLHSRRQSLQRRSSDCNLFQPKAAPSIKIIMQIEDDSTPEINSEPATTVATATTAAPASATQPSTAPTVSSSTPEPPLSSAPLAIAPLAVEVVPKLGIRNLRGVPTSVPTGELNVIVDGKQRAWTRERLGSPIHATAEFLPHEIPQLQEAVKSFRGDSEAPVFKPLPRGNNDEIKRLQAM